MLSVRMGTGVEMVLWLRRFSFLPPRRATSHSSHVHHGPRFTHRHGHFKHEVCHGPKRHNSTVSEGGSGGSSKEQSTGWRYWLAIWRPLPLSVGLAVLAILQWRRIIRRTRDGQVTQVAKDWEITCYKAVPLRVMSRAWGWITQCELPLSLRPWVLGLYASKFKCNLDEAESSDLTTYRSLSEFFCRPLKDGCRPINGSCIVSPADGQVLSVGRVTHCKVEQVKGVTYSLQAFLGPPTWTEDPGEPSDYFKPPSESLPFTSTPEDRKWKDSEYERCLLENEDTSLYQCVVYLAPGDYHRFHSPVQWSVSFRRHFQGELLSVNPRIARWIPDLFNLNERAVYVGRWTHGFFSLTAVGATNVGSIHVYCDKSLRTNQRKWRGQESRKRDLHLEGPDGAGVPVAKGQPFGEFRLGSTVVLIFEAPKDFEFDAQAGRKILVGAGLCRDVPADPPLTD